MAACAVKNTPLRFVAMTSFQASYLMSRPAEGRDPCIGQDDVEPPQLRHSRVHGRPHAGPVTDVDLLARNRRPCFSTSATVSWRPASVVNG